ncbi:MAG: RpiB/LacA/LacB family sugar-phosphate isomerase [Phycisphaerae bacterium]|nr:RpiB/LacA/LacB family sugar-phosphate isomerase [Phycisphaerae bacterium]MCZ2399910.1 RpiB/LacA/LacB family sugar-phosphate isomerase [Phycisphaerae bacterium]NUQ49707.1 RpiB/LacA/LacB family sugar-phosphate isomerase [Phycisphaerae bacterium]
MLVGLAADHGGFELKQALASALKTAGHHVRDFGAFAADPADDYPDFVIPLARAVADASVQRGVAVCGSGVGAAVAANKVRGVRAGLCHDHYSAGQGVEHDDMNVLVLGGRVVGFAVAWDNVQAFLAARYTGEARHARRLGKVLAIEIAGH